jgi:polysaccharide biosynthesis transport protein
MTDEGGLPELLDALRWRWKVVLAIALPLFAGTTLYVESLPSQYTGEAIVTVAPRVDNPAISPTQVTVGAPKYVAYATAPATVRRLAQELGEDAREMEESVEATLAADTGDITVAVTLTSPERAVEAANRFAEDLVAFSGDDPLLEASIVAPASIPSEPSGPPRRLLEASSLVLGLMLGFAIAFMIERSRPRVRTWRDIAVLSGYPVVGRLPSSRAVRGGQAAALTDPIVGAAVRTLRTNLEREIGHAPRGVVAVTSSIPGEGKSASASVFATALARLDVRVLLIDADLHRAGLSRSFQPDRTGGLAGLLRGYGTLQEKLQPGWTPNLMVLPTATDPDGGELLARHFQQVLDQVRHHFDVIVVDAPPILGGDDAATIATVSDGVLFVVSIGSMAGPVSEAVLALRTLRANVWGVVANRVPRTGLGGAAAYVYSAVGG